MGASKGPRNNTMSACLMLIRHAEKPSRGDEGVDARGKRDCHSLCVVGWQRAGALVPYFTRPDERSGRAGMRTPQYIFAARPTPAHPSTRPCDTVQPLATALGLTIDDRWSGQDPVERLADHFRRLDGAALVCWRHGDLPALARAIGQGIDDEIPNTWPADRFDLTWLIRHDGTGWRFDQLPQFLLPGDRLANFEIDRAIKAR